MGGFCHSVFCLRVFRTVVPLWFAMRWQSCETVASVTECNCWAVVQDELVLDTGVAKLADFGLSKTIASLAPNVHHAEATLQDSEGAATLGMEASGGSVVSAATRGGHGSKHKIVQLVSPSRQGTVDMCAAAALCSYVVLVVELIVVL